MNIVDLGPKRPVVQSAYIAQGATVVGEVHLKPGSSVWYNAVLRGDQQLIDVGVDANVQDLALLHAEHHPTVIGPGSSVGHGAIVHGAMVGENTLIGMGAVLNEGVRVGNNCLIASGAVLPPNTIIPDNSLVMGAPGKVVRAITESELQVILDNTVKYKAKADKYMRTAAVRQELAWAA